MADSTASTIDACIASILDEMHFPAAAYLATRNVDGAMTHEEMPPRMGMTLYRFLRIWNRSPTKPRRSPEVFFPGIVMVAIMRLSCTMNWQNSRRNAGPASAKPRMAPAGRRRSQERKESCCCCSGVACCHRGEKKASVALVQRR